MKAKDKNDEWIEYLLQLEKDFQEAIVENNAEAILSFQSYPPDAVTSATSSHAPRRN